MRDVLRGAVGGAFIRRFIIARLGKKLREEKNNKDKEEALNKRWAM